MQAPFPWFGGKSAVAGDVWAALGDVAHYIEPFFGSGAVLLQRPHAARFETVNDADGLLANFWRAIRHAPDEVAHHADWPVNEADLHARHWWLVQARERLTERLMGDADWYDAKAAGWWVWGACAWIGSGWCSGEGPWQAIDGVLTDTRQLPDLSSAQGINRKMPHLANKGRGVHQSSRPAIADWFAALSDRLRHVRVACGDWSRVMGPAAREAGGGVCGVFLDPPYSRADRADVYAHESDCTRDVNAWCAANGHDPALRIVLAGYAGEHDNLEALGWRVKPWKAHGGYGNQGEARGRDNAARERLWLSPSCESLARDLFGGLA
jgi:DNA adenine methylase